MIALTTCRIVIVVVRAEPTKPAAGLVVVVVGAEAPKSTAEGHVVVYAAVARACMLS